MEKETAHQVIDRTARLLRREQIAADGIMLALLSLRIGSPPTTAVTHLEDAERRIERLGMGPYQYTPAPQRQRRAPTDDGAIPFSQHHHSH